MVDRQHTSLLHFFCVDDDPDFIDYLLTSAEPFSITFDVSPSFQDALSKIQVAYDAYIIDLNLPDGSGFDLIKEIRSKQNSQLPVAVISGFYHDAESFRKLKEEYRINYVLEKPIYPKQVEDLLKELSKERSSAPPKPKDKMEELKQHYDKTICDKLDRLTQLVRAVQVNQDPAKLLELKTVSHKIAGSAGSYGYRTVSTLCKELELNLEEKIRAPQKIDKDFLNSLDDFLNRVKYHFQVSEFVLTSIKPTFISNVSRPSLYVVDHDLKFLNLLEKEKEDFFLDLIVESNPKKALASLKSDDFNPRAVIVSQYFLNSKIDAYDLINACRHKQKPLHTLYGMLIEKNSLKNRLEATQQGVQYLFQKPVSAKALLKDMADTISCEHLLNFKVLIVDDDEEVCHYIATVLKEIGIDVHVIFDPEHIFEALERYAPQLLLLDIMFPHYDGLNLLKTLRADRSFRDLIVVIITARNDTETRTKAYSADADGILYKPLDKSVIQSRVIHLARRHALVGHLSNPHQLIGLDSLDTLKHKLHEKLVYNHTRSLCLAAFELHRFAELTLLHGHLIMNQQLISISNLLQRLNSHSLSCFLYGEAGFALLFEGPDIHAVQNKVQEILSIIIRDAHFHFNLCCAIVPVMSTWGGVNEIMAALEQGVHQANLNQTPPVNIVIQLPKGETIHKKEVIVIDPDQEVLNILTNVFEAHDISVKTFTKGEEGLKEITDRSEEHLPALVIAERRLSDMDGLELLKKINTRFHTRIPFYFLTIYASDKDRTEGLECGALDYITKPFNLSIFVQKTMNVIFESNQIPL